MKCQLFTDAIKILRGLDMENKTEVGRKTLPENAQPQCPDCGAAMLQLDSSHENGDHYVWYECSRQDCSGQWLQKEQ